MRLKGLVLLLVVMQASAAWAADREVAPEADKAFKAMCAYLQSQEKFSMRQDAYVDKVFPNGMKIKYYKRSDVTIQRPDKLRSDTRGDDMDRLVVINGPDMTVYERDEKAYASLEVPPGLDKALDFILARFEVNAPTSDLLRSDIYDASMAGVTLGYYVGESEVNGEPCRHLAYRQMDVDWEIWIAKGDKPLPLKVVITDKTLHGNPQHEVVMSGWKMSPRLKKGTFAFTPPKDAKQADLFGEE